MSERGSFVTQYIYCEKCLKAAKKVLARRIDKHFWGSKVPGYPIIAGKIGGMGSGDELLTFEFEIVPELQKLICDPLRVVVMADCGSDRVFHITPEGYVAPEEIEIIKVPND